MFSWSGAFSHGNAPDLPGRPRYPDRSTIRWAYNNEATDETARLDPADAVDRQPSRVLRQRPSREPSCAARPTAPTEHRHGARGRHALGRDARRRPSVHRDAAHGPGRARGRPVSQRLRHDAALLAEPGQLPDGPVRPHQRHHRQHGAPQPHASNIPGGTPTRGLSDGILRQVAHGQRRQPASRFQSLGGHARPGRGHRPVIERGWRASPREGLHDRPPHRLRRALHRASLRSAVPGVPGTQGDSSECDSEGRWEPGADSGSTRRVRGG